MPTEKNEQEKRLLIIFILLNLYVCISILSSFPTRFKPAPLMYVSLDQHSFPYLPCQSPPSLLPHHLFFLLLLRNQPLHSERSHTSTPSTRISLVYTSYLVHLPPQKRLSRKSESVPGTVTKYTRLDRSGVGCGKIAVAGS
ncbi:hypothetical protein K435DRAFT_487915 [Dendrothele bispora CBS 962.96]|uniref:Uncharacterized protein n=1 Tax=Dendrothele bispora (strain CBS 962.96) TaxID=1314807 RepID=A0A4S8KYA5_DENBC|nr:hypothetical protein K435DRAFT_487915 [Dendrothele bispora CBS 962.96]